MLTAHQWELISDLSSHGLDQTGRISGMILLRHNPLKDGTGNPITHAQTSYYVHVVLFKTHNNRNPAVISWAWSSNAQTTQTEKSLLYTPFESSMWNTLYTNPNKNAKGGRNENLRSVKVTMQLNWDEGSRNFSGIGRRSRLICWGDTHVFAFLPMRLLQACTIRCRESHPNNIKLCGPSATKFLEFCLKCNHDPAASHLRYKCMQ